MNRTITSILALTLCVFLARCTNAESGDDFDHEDESTVTIVLTKLEVTDANLDLSWKVKNNTDHDVWICDNINTHYPSLFEAFLAQDAETLIIRKRFDLPIYKGVIWELAFQGRYVRLHPGQERTESVSLTIPVGRYRQFEGEEVEQTNAEYARRLILEIGFYNEDLPGMILHIVELAERLNCASGVLRDNDLEIYGRFFGGLVIASFFSSSSWSSFRESINEGGEEILMPHMQLVRMGEQVLRLTVDGVSIPYKSSSPPLTGHTGKRTRDEQRHLRSSHNKDKPDREKGSDRNDTDMS